MKMREMAYKVHPYRWMTIGKELSHIENATLDDVKAFFFQHYRPVNAILVVAGKVTTAEVQRLAEKWFGPIEAGTPYVRNLPREPIQQDARKEAVEAAVPLDALYKTWHMAGRTDPRYYAMDLLGEVLGGGASSRLYQSLVKEKKLFSNIECYHYGTLDPGLVAIDGKLVKGVAMETAEAAVDEELEKVKTALIDSRELEKVKHKTESMIAFEDMSITNRAASLASYEHMGDASLMNKELDKYRAVAAGALLDEARAVFVPENSNTLYYHAK